jgi:hypothetical protein
MGGKAETVCTPQGAMVCEARVLRNGELNVEACSEAIYEMLARRAKDKAIEYANIVFGWENKDYTDATINFRRFDEAERYTPGSNEIDLSIHEVGSSGNTTVAWTMSGTYYCTKKEDNSPKGSPLASR